MNLIQAVTASLFNHYNKHLIQGVRSWPYPTGNSYTPGKKAQSQRIRSNRRKARR